MGLEEPSFVAMRTGEHEHTVKPSGLEIHAAKKAALYHYCFGTSTGTTWGGATGGCFGASFGASFGSSFTLMPSM